MPISDIDLSAAITRAFRTIQDFIRPDNPSEIPFATQQAAFDLANPTLHLKDYDPQNQLFQLEGHKTPHLGYAVSFQCSTAQLPSIKQNLETWLQSLPPLTAFTWAWLSSTTDQPPINNYHPKKNQQFIFLRTPITSDVTHTKNLNKEIQAILQSRDTLLSILNTSNPSLMSPQEIQTLQLAILRFNPHTSLLNPSTTENNPPTPFEINTDGSLSFSHNNSPWATHLLTLDAWPQPSFNSADQQPQPASIDTFPLSSMLCPQVAGLHLIPFSFYYFIHINICSPAQISPYLQTTHTPHSCANKDLHLRKPWFHDLLTNPSSFSPQTPQYKFQAGLICTAPEDIATSYIQRIQASAREHNFRLSTEPFLTPRLILQATPFQYHDSYDSTRRANFAYFSHIFNLLPAPWASIPSSAQQPLPVTAISASGDCPPLCPEHLHHKIILGGIGTGKTALTNLLSHAYPQTLLITSSTPQEPHSAWHSFEPKPPALPLQNIDPHSLLFISQILALLHPSFSPSQHLHIAATLSNAISQALADNPPPNPPSWHKIRNHPELASIPLLEIYRHTPQKNQPPSEPQLTRALFIPPLWQEQPSTLSALSCMIALACEILRNPPSQLIIDDLRAFDCPQLPSFFTALTSFLNTKKIPWACFSRLPQRDPEDLRWSQLLRAQPLGFLCLPEQALTFLVDTDLLDDTHSLETCRQLSFTPSSFDLFLPLYTHSTPNPHLQEGPQPSPLTLHIN